MTYKHDGLARAGAASPESNASNRRGQNTTAAVSITKPFKKFAPEDMRKLARLPGPCIAIWLHYYSRAGKDGRSWAKRAELLRLCGVMDKETMYRHRKMLIDNGWLAQTGTRNEGGGKKPVPIFRTSFGEVFAGEKSRRVTRVRNPDAHAGENLALHAGEKSGPEVDRKIEVDGKREVVGGNIVCSSIPGGTNCRDGEQSPVQITGKREKNSARKEKAENCCDGKPLLWRGDHYECQIRPGRCPSEVRVNGEREKARVIA